MLSGYLTTYLGIYGIDGDKDRNVSQFPTSYGKSYRDSVEVHGRDLMR